MAAKDLFHDAVKQMERVEQYRQSIRQILMSHATFESGNSDIELQLVLDTEHNHYQLLEVGWEGLKRIYNCIIHLDSAQYD